jgi:hypothetical protein
MDGWCTAWTGVYRLRLVQEDRQLTYASGIWCCARERDNVSCHSTFVSVAKHYRYLG